MKEKTNKTIKLLAIKKVVNSGKTKFNTYITKMNLVVKGEEEKGTQEKWVSLKFRKEVTQPNKSCILICNAKDVDVPSKFVVVEKDGKKIYPEVWVRAIQEVKELNKKVDQNAFVVDEEDDEEVDV